MPPVVKLIRSATLSGVAEYAYAATAPAGSRLIFLAGACPLNADGSTAAVGDYAGQAAKAFENLRTALVTVVRPLTSHGGHFLVETTDVLQYYLPDTTWQQWSDTASNPPQYYLQRIRQHYYAVIVLGFNQTLSTDYAIALELSSASGYTLAAKVRSGRTVFDVWEYAGRV